MGCGASKPDAQTVQDNAAVGSDGFFLLHNADFTGRDERTTTEACGSVEAAAKLLASKPRQPSTCYAWRHASKLVSIPAVGAGEMGNGAKWVGGAKLIVCGKDTGHRSKGKLLVALENVDCCFGDGQVFGGVGSYDAALRMVKAKDNVTQTAYFWHSGSSRLIEKPKDRGANWVGYPGYGWLFLWADERVGSSLSPKGTDDSIGGAAVGGSGGSSSSAALSLGSTPSHGNPASSSALNTELNNVARNTDDTATARALVASGADLASTNGEPWRHTPLHQAAFHGRFEMAKTLVELGAPLELHSNPCGRGEHGTPIELARGGGHHAIAEMLEKAMQGKGGGKTAVPSGGGGSGSGMAPEPPVVMGVVLSAQAVVEPHGSPQAAPSEAVEVAVAAKGQAPMTIMEQVAILKRELSLEGNVKDVVDQAATQLGVSAEGMPLAALAAACMKVLGHAAEQMG